MTAFQWQHSTAFYQRVERCNLHGLHFQHIALCQRRAWLYLHKVNFAHWHNRVKTGTALHASSYQRDHSVRGLLGLAPDRIDWQQRIVYENKGSSGAVLAANAQTAFYALMLSICTGYSWRAYTHVLSSRRRREVKLDTQQLQQLWDASVQLEQLFSQGSVPHAQLIPLCQSCSAANFCDFEAEV